LPVDRSGTGSIQFIFGNVEYKIPRDDLDELIRQPFAASTLYHDGRDNRALASHEALGNLIIYGDGSTSDEYYALWLPLGRYSHTTPSGNHEWRDADLSKLIDSMISEMSWLKEYLENTLTTADYAELRNTN